jgi:large subunit ribosomal protein L21
MLYAIIENGGKQYKAVEGKTIEIDRLDLEVGKKVSLDKVLLLVDDNGSRVGTPLVKGVSVDTTVVSHFKGPKIVIFKYRAKERYRKKTGHRQQYTRLMVDSIAYADKPKVSKKEAAPVVAELKTKKPATAKAKPRTTQVKGSKAKPVADKKAAVKKASTSKAAAKK